MGNDKVIAISKKELKNLLLWICFEGLGLILLMGGWFTTYLFWVTEEPQVIEVEVIKEIEVVKEVEVEVEKIVYVEKEEPEFTESDIELMARVVMSEASVLDIDGKYAVAATIVNRVRSEEFPNTVADVVYQANAYSTADNGEPTEDCYKVVRWAIESQVFPTDMYYFRTDHYHTFGKPLMKIGNTYFSRQGDKK